MLLSIALLLSSAATPMPTSTGVPALPSTPLLGDEIPEPPASALVEARRRRTALQALRSPLPEDLNDQELVRAQIRRAVAGSVALGKSSETARGLREASRLALETAPKNPKAAALLVDLKIQAAARDLAFSPVMEAGLPKGFPWPVPAGEIRVQEYPGYRKAVTGMQGNAQNGAFFKLFRHITSNDIPMTAPVEMTMDSNEMIDMAFLYGDPAWGEAGDAGRVEVADIEPMTVVSIGVRGTTRSARTMDAVEELEAWLERNRDEWEPAGNPRMMGYNGPMVPRRKQFCEVQIPVQRRIPPTVETTAK